MFGLAACQRKKAHSELSCNTLVTCDVRLILFIIIIDHYYYLRIDIYRQKKVFVCGCVRVWLLAGGGVVACVGACVCRSSPPLLLRCSSRTSRGAVRAPAASLREAPSPEAVGQGRLGDLQDVHQDGEEARSRTVWRSLDG